MKEFLSKAQVAYRERNVLEGSAAVAELAELGYMTTPVTVVDGETVVGFDVEKLRKVLHLDGEQNREGDAA